MTSFVYLKNFCSFLFENKKRALIILLTGMGFGILGCYYCMQMKLFSVTLRKPAPVILKHTHNLRITFGFRLIPFHFNNGINFLVVLIQRIAAYVF